MAETIEEAVASFEALPGADKVATHAKTIYDFLSAWKDCELNLHDWESIYVLARCMESDSYKMVQQKKIEASFANGGSNGS